MTRAQGHQALRFYFINMKQATLLSESAITAPRVGLQKFSDLRVSAKNARQVFLVDSSQVEERCDKLSLLQTAALKY